MSALSRTRLVQIALAAAGALLVDPRAAVARVRAPSVAALSVRNVGRRYKGDRRLFASVSPGVRGRDRASIRFSLDRPALVRLEAVRTLRRRTTVWRTEQALAAGAHRIWWKPDPSLAVDSYVMRLTVEDEEGNRKPGEAVARHEPRRPRPRRRGGVREAQLRAPRAGAADGPPSGNHRPRPDPESVRTGPERRDELLRDVGGSARLLGGNARLWGGL